MIDISSEILLITEEIQHLHAMSHRIDMNDFFHLESRMKQIQKCAVLFKKFEEHIDPRIANKIKNDIKYILLENWSRQILPNHYGIIPPGRNKVESYLNKDGYFGLELLEPRSYIGIDPTAFGHLDTPSIVTALTPARYCQPEHSHSGNYEITFYADPSLVKYRNNGDMCELPVSYGDFAIIPPDTIHTIENPSDTPMMNISIKLPGALLDRGKTIDNRTGTCRIEHMTQTPENGIYIKTFPDIDIPYTIGIYDFYNITTPKVAIKSQWKAACYVISWEYVGHFSDEEKQYVLQAESTIILDGKRDFIVDTVVNPGIMYQAELI